MTDDFFDKLGDFLDKGRRTIKDRFTLDVTDLLRALDANDPDEVARALGAGVDPNRRDGLYRIALPIATDNNNAEIVKMLLDAKANPKLRDPNGDTALYKAVYWENAAIVEMLLEAGADPHQPNGNGKTPIEEAQANNNREVLALLVDFQDDKRSRQRESDRAKHENMKAKAAEARARREAAAKKEAEMKAQQQREAEAKAKQEVEAAYGVEDGDYSRALLKAMRSKDTEAVKAFIKKVTDINAYDVFYNTTPLMLAIQMQNTKLATFFIEKGADPLHYIKQMKHSPFTKAVSHSMYDLVKYIVEKSPEEVKNLCNDTNQLLSPQFLAYKDARMLDLLIGAGADPNLGGQDVPAPIVKAIEKASVAILPVLARHKVDLNRLADGKTLLSWAVEYNRTDWVTGLLAEGALVNTPNADGESSLAYAERLADRQAIVEILREEA